MGSTRIGPSSRGSSRAESGSVRDARSTAGLRRPSALACRPIAFPLGNTRADFVAEVNRARSRLPA
jgi:hypothetical protein